jgi:flagellar basal body rod protein FlgB
MNTSIDKIQPYIKTDKSTSLREDGNNVDLDMELAELAEIRFVIIL